MVEDGAELVLDRPQVYRRIGFPLSIPVTQQFILPGDNLLRRDIAQLEPSEVGGEFAADDVLLGTPSVFLQSRFHILRVSVDEAGKGHIHIRRNLVQLLTLPGLGLPLGGKPTF